MHIVIANRWYPTENGSGGVARYNRTLAHALCALGHRVSVATQGRRASRYADGPVAVYALAAPAAPAALRRLPPWRWRERTLLCLWYSAALGRALARLHRAQPFDVVEFADVLAEGWAYTRWPRRPAPALVRCHAPTALLARSPAARRWGYEWRALARCEALAARRADALSAPSHSMASEGAGLAGLRGAGIRVVPNPLHLPPRGCDASTGDAPLVLMVGRYEEAKGAHLLAEAIPLALAQTPARFVVAGADRPYGQSTMRAWLRARLAAAGCGERVALLEEADAAGLDALYRRAALALVPSTPYESFSYTAADAMAYGVAVVASDVGGMAETLGDGGALVPPDDTAALAARIVELLRQPAERARMGAAGRARAARLFDPAAVARQMESLYREVAR